MTEIIAISSPIICFLIMQLFGVRLSLIISGIIFILSAIADSYISVKNSFDNNNLPKIHIFRDLLAGISYLLHKKDILNFIILSTIINFFLAGYNLVLPYTNFFPIWDYF